MWRVKRLLAEQNRSAVLIVSGLLILVIFLVSQRTEHHAALGSLYLFPILLASGLTCSR